MAPRAWSSCPTTRWGRASRPTGHTGRGPGSAPRDWSNRMTSKRLFLSRASASLLWFSASSLPTSPAWKLCLFLFSLPPTFLERSDAILHRRACSKYLEVPPVLSPLSQMVGRVTSHVLASAQGRGVCEQGGVGPSTCSGAGAPTFSLFPTSPPIPGAQETSGAAPDGKRAGAWRKTRCRCGHRLSTEYILSS